MLPIREHSLCTPDACPIGFVNDPTCQICQCIYEASVALSDANAVLTIHCTRVNNAQRLCQVNYVWFPEQLAQNKC
jgi:hypothetical protein